MVEIKYQKQVIIFLYIMYFNKCLQRAPRAWCCRTLQQIKSIL